MSESKIGELTPDKKNNQIEEEEDPKDKFIERLLKKVPANGLIDVILSKSFPEDKKEMALERLKTNLRDRYMDGNIKSAVVDSMALYTFGGDKKLVSNLNYFFKHAPVEELLQATAGAVTYQEKEEIVKTLWKLAKKNMAEKERDNKQSEIEKNFDDLRLLYISLGGRNFVKENEIVGKIDELIERYKAGKKEVKTSFDEYIRS